MAPIAIRMACQPWMPPMAAVWAGASGPPLLASEVPGGGTGAAKAAGAPPAQMAAASAARMAAQRRRMRCVLFMTDLPPAGARVYIAIVGGDVSRCHESAVPGGPGISGPQERAW